VRDAGEAMDNIVGGVRRVTDVIGEISAAAREQSEGIAVVNGSVVQLDQMTQQNAALVEESAAAAESLKDQAQRLTQSMQVFRLSGSATAAPTASYAAPRPAPAAPVVRAAPPAARPAAPVRPPEAAQAAISQARETSRPVTPPSNDDWESF